MKNELVRLWKTGEKAGVEIFLVGGCLRDLFLEKNIRDLDIVVDKKVKWLSQRFADSERGKLIELDRERKVYRVVTKDYIFDFSSLQGANIEKDLLSRDFTINALGVKLEDFLQYNLELQDSIIIDPGGGLKDLKRKIICQVRENSFRQDPLRLLRGIRLTARLEREGFRLDDKTFTTLQSRAHLISRVAGERIREELILIFKYLDSTCSAECLLKSGLMRYIFPRSKVPGFSPETRGAVFLHLDKLIRDKLFRQQLKSDKTHLLKMLGLIAVPGYRIENDKQSPVKWSKSEYHFLHLVLNNYQRVFDLYNIYIPPAEKIYNFYLASQPFTAEVIVLAAAIYGVEYQLRNLFRKFAERILRDCARIKEQMGKDYLNGELVKRLLNIYQGPQVGEVLADLRMSAAVGKFNTEKEAVHYLLQKYNHRK